MDGKRIAKIRHHLHSFLFSPRHSFHDSAKSSVVDEEDLRSSSIQKRTSRTTNEIDCDACPKITILPAYSKYLRHDQLRREQERQNLNSRVSLEGVPSTDSGFEDSSGRQETYNRIRQKSSSFQSDAVKSKVELGNSIRRSVTPDTNCRFSVEEPRGVGIVPAVGCQGDGQSDSWPHPRGSWIAERSYDGSAPQFGSNWVTSNNDEEPNLLEKSSQDCVSDETVRNFFGFEDSILTSFKAGDFTVRDVSVSDITDNDVVDKYLNSIRDMKSGSSSSELKHPVQGSNVTSRISASRSLEFDHKVFERREFDDRRLSWHNKAPGWTSPDGSEYELERSERENQFQKKPLFSSDWSPECKTNDRGGSVEASDNESTRSLLTSSYIPYMCDDLSNCYRHLAYQTFPFSTGRRSVEERLEAVAEELRISRSSKPTKTKTVRFAPDVTKYPSCEGFSNVPVQRVSPRSASVEMSRVLRELQEVGDKRKVERQVVNELKLKGKPSVTTSEESKSTSEDNGEQGSESPVWQLRVPIIRITKADDDSDDDADEILDATNGSNPPQVKDSFVKVKGYESGSGNGSRPVVGLSRRKISEQDLQQVEMFYRSHKTELFVCRCRVTLFFGSVRRHSTVTTSDPDLAAAELNPESKWTPTKSGILLIVLDSGESRRHRKLYVILAEIGSGFMLWRDSVDHLTNYCNLSSIFHTMHMSHDHTRLAGFLFEDNAAAADFYRKFTSLVSNKDDTLLNLSRATARRPRSLPRKFRRNQSAAETKFSLNKADISGPCCFTHVTKMDRSTCDIDVERYLDSTSCRLEKSPVKSIDVSLLMERSSSRKFKERNFRINVLKSSK